MSSESKPNPLAKLDPETCGPKPRVIPVPSHTKSIANLYKLGAPCFFYIPAVDLSRAQRFYENVFEYTFSPIPEGTYPPEEAVQYSLFNFCDFSYSVTGSLKKVDKVVPCSEDSVHMFLFVDSVDETLGKIGKEGGKIVKGKHPQGNMGQQAYFEDTEGLSTSPFIHSPWADYV